MALILAAITRNFGHILDRFFRFLSWNVSCIDSRGWDRVFLVLFLISSTLFLLLPSFFGGLNVISALSSCHFLNPNLRFFNFKNFHRATWGAGFSCSDVSWPKTFRTVLIHLLSGDIESEWRFSLGFYNIFLSTAWNSPVPGLNILIWPR